MQTRSRGQQPVVICGLVLLALTVLAACTSNAATGRTAPESPTPHPTATQAIVQAPLTSSAAPRSSPLPAMDMPRATAWHVARASSYGIGDGMVGTRLACGGTLTANTLTVGHRSLPCGTLVELRLGARSIIARVMDRGPHIPGLAFNLAPAVCRALRDCSGDILIRWRVATTPHAGPLLSLS